MTAITESVTSSFEIVQVIGSHRCSRRESWSQDVTARSGPLCVSSFTYLSYLLRLPRVYFFLIFTFLHIFLFVLSLCVYAYTYLRMHVYM
jgi:hypothetical protein